MPQPYFVKGLIGKVLAYGGLQIRTSLPHGLQPTNERRAESKLASFVVFVFSFRF